MYKAFLAFIISIICLQSQQGNAQVGNIAPDFTVTDTHGETHRLYDYLDAGKSVILDFFFTTCGPCIYYSPQVNLAYEKYGCNEADVVFIGIDFDDTNAEVIAYDEEYQIKYPSISGKEGGGNNVVSAYNVLAFPTFYVIDSTKKIIHEIDPPTLQVFDYYL
ncbi:MAG: TlpA disulfide reductase family protein, partial [Saprospiraceae bacterium]